MSVSKTKICCIGKAGQDVFLQSNVFRPVKDKGVLYEHIKLGEKFSVDHATLSPGGNAPNAAVTFARHGFEVTFIGAVGDDQVGHVIVEALDREHITTQSVRIVPNARSSFSTILLAPTGERTILDYHGDVTLEEISFKSTLAKSDWLYISSVGSMEHLLEILKYAHAHSTNVAFNPGSHELAHIQDTANLLRYVTLLALNKEEAQMFVDGSTTKELALRLAHSVKYALVSDGPRGATATDGLEIVQGGMYEDVAVVDRTGAGDAFTSGFVASLVDGKSLTDAMVFASANSTSVVQHIGARDGILRGDARLHDMPLKISHI